MTTYRLFPSTSGPSSPVSYTGNILTGVLFKVTQGGMFFSGYYKWVATGEDTTSRKFALWEINGNGTGVHIPAADVTSGTLTANAWNFVALSVPIPLSIGTAYNATTGWAAVSGHGFSDSDTTGAGTGATDSYGTGGHTAGITNGPLFAYSDGAGGGGTKGEPFGTHQGNFGVGGTDATAIMSNGGSASGNFWMDVQVSDQTPGNYAGTYRLYPNKTTTNSATVPDSSVNYSVATEFELSQPCTLNKIWYYSPSGTAQLATSCRIWTITGANSGSSVVTQTSPSWSGAAGSGWISCSFANTTLPAGSYKVSVYNGQASPDGWSAKDATTNYWGTGGDGVNGITWGPLTAPGLSTASLAYKFFGGNPGQTPPYTDGSTTEKGQCTFVNGTGDTYPYLYVDALGQNYWLDVEVTPVVNPAFPFEAIRQRRETWPRGLPRRGRIAPPVRAQLNPPYPVTVITQHRQAPRALARRGRQVTVTPPQLNPPWPVTEVRQGRQPRGLQPRRGHAFTPVPVQQAPPVNPAWVPVPARHPRLLLPRRGRIAQVPQAQAAAVAPAWVQSHRSPLRALAMIRRRFLQLMPWPQATRPPFTIGSLTASTSAGGTTGTATATYAPPAETTTSP